jgi:sterol desaturase/sphingolipid hydroxylase (fatty acid hydroxylase superfamily)
MHIWHHAKELPNHVRYGVNFGLTLSIWDYLFKTSYVPHSGKDIILGFEGDEDFPKQFLAQELYPLNINDKKK